LQVSQPGDAFEQEADRVANQVMRMEAPTAPGRNTPEASSRTEFHSSGVQRQAQNLSIAAIGSSHWDFHWYRKDADKAWSYKRGRFPARRRRWNQPYLQSVPGQPELRGGELQQRRRIMVCSIVWK
jgi:hypothetical protein